jgi:hypothetical protein
MESIRDRHCDYSKGQQSKDSDWFSFAVLSFTMFTGIHPYKGKHPTIKDWNERFLKNMSVLNSEVKVPKAAFDFSVIPPNYLDWYTAVLEKGKRLEPPFEGEFVVIESKPIIKIIQGTNNFNIQVIKQYDDKIIEHDYFSDKVYTDDYLKKGNTFCFNKSLGDTLIGKIENKKLKLLKNNKELSVDMNATHTFTSQGRFFIINDDIYEIKVRKGNNIVSSLKVANGSPSLQLFDNTLIQNMLGTYYLSIFPESGGHHQIKLESLEGHRIINAKFEKNICIVVGEKKGKYYRFIFKFKNNDILNIEKESTDNIDLNFTVLDNNICVLINDDNNIELFNTSKGKKIIEDDGTIASGRLSHYGVQTLLFKDDKLYKLNMK